MHSLRFYSFRRGSLIRALACSEQGNAQTLARRSWRAPRGSAARLQPVLGRSAIAVALSLWSAKQTFYNAEPFRVQRFSAHWLSCPTIPVGCVALVALLAVQIRMHPRTLDAFILLCGFVRSRPIALRVPPQSGEGVRESGWPLSRGERLAKFVQGHGAIFLLLYAKMTSPFVNGSRFVSLVS
jgi:hypothetical protein